MGEGTTVCTNIKILFSRLRFDPCDLRRRAAEAIQKRRTRKSYLREAEAVAAQK